MYLKNEKNFEVTLDQFLTGNIPKDEFKVVVLEESKKEDDVPMMINTASSKPKKEKSDLLQYYTLG